MTKPYFPFLLICAMGALLFSLIEVHANTESDGGISIVQRPETIRISEQGRIYIGERETNLNQLGRRLKRDGYKPNDTIYVSIPDETPRRVLVAVGRELASQGFRRVIFTKPPRTVAEAEAE